MKLFLSTTVFLSLLFSTQGKSQENKIPSTVKKYSEAHKGKIDAARKLVYELIRDYPAISISVSLKDEVIWTESFGYSNVKEKTPSTPDGLLRIYSNSKILTGTLAAKLWEDKKLDLNEKVINYLPDIPNSMNNITVLQLINHTSGIRNYRKGEWMKISLNDCKTANEALGVFIHDPLESKPGEKYTYSSFNYVLLSAVLAAAGNQSFDTLMNQYVFIPGNMNAIYHDEPMNNRENLYSFYVSKRKIAPKINNSCKWGGGGYNASAESLVNFGIALTQEKLVGAEALNLMFSKNKLNSGENFNYGFGLGIVSSKATGGVFASHSGSGMGGSSAVRIYPKERLVIVILGNIEDDGIKNNISELSEIFLRD